MAMKRVWIGVFACGVMASVLSAQTQDKKDSDKKKDEKVVVTGTAVAPEAGAAGGLDD